MTVCNVYHTVKTLMLACPLFRKFREAKKNREIEGREYQLQASISNCIVLIRQNKRGQNNFAC